MGWQPLTSRGQLFAHMWSLAIPNMVIPIDGVLILYAGLMAALMGESYITH